MSIPSSLHHRDGFGPHVTGFGPRAFDFIGAAAIVPKESFPFGFEPSCLCTERVFSSFSLLLLLILCSAVGPSTLAPPFERRPTGCRAEECSSSRER